MIATVGISAFAAAWETAIIRASWQGGLALCLAWAVCNIWRNLPGGAKCWIWRLAYAKLLIALLWIAPIALPVLKPSNPLLIINAQSAALPRAIETAQCPINVVREQFTEPSDNYQSGSGSSF